MLKFRNMLLAGAMLAPVLSWGATPKYIFYFIGDGMGIGQAMAAQTYNRVARGADQPLLMMQFPYAGMVVTYSASSTVTDSSAAGTALSSGYKTNNGMLGVTPDSTAMESMAKVLHDNGWGVGLVTTVAPDDATPGAFYAHVPHRSMSYEIGIQAADCDYEFIAGSSWRGAERDGKSTGLIEYMKGKGIDMVSTTADVDASKSRRVFLTSSDPFSAGNIGYTIDSIPGALTLPEMTSAAIRHLEKVTPERFFMMVEGGNIDHAGHANDGAAVAVEVINFNEALARAYDFYNRYPDETLIVVTADHETGGLSVGNRHVGYTSHTELVPWQKVSKERFGRDFDRLMNGETIPSWENVKEYAREALGLWGPVKVSEAQEKELRDIYDATVAKKQVPEGETTLYASFGALSSHLFHVLNDNQGFGWTTPNHSGNMVPVYAVGAGAEQFGRQLDNTQIAPIMMKIAGYEF